MKNDKYYDSLDKDIMNKYAPGADISKPLFIITSVIVDDDGKIDDGGDYYIHKIALPGWYQVSEIGIGIREKKNSNSYIMIRWDDVENIIQTEDLEDIYDELADDDYDDPDDIDDYDDDDDDLDDYDEDDLLDELGGKH